MGPLKLQIAVNEIVLLQAPQALADLARPDGPDALDRLEVALGGADDRLERAEAGHDLADDRLGQADVFVNVAGGVRIDEPGADLAVALAIASAAKRVPVKPGIAAFGEIGLTGRLRPAAQAERRLEECTKLGLRGVIAPSGTTSARSTIAVAQAETLQQAIKAGLDGGAHPED